MPRTTMEVSRRIIHALELFEKQLLRVQVVVRLGDVVYASYLARDTRHHTISAGDRDLFAFAELCDNLSDEEEKE